jgi:hypothetical protein
MQRLDRISAILLSSLLSATPAVRAFALPQDARAESRSVSALSFVDDSDGTRIDIRIENGKVVVAKVNGKDLPADRVRQVPDGVEILDEKGEVMRHLRIGGAGNGAFAAPSAPKSMIGLGFAQVDEALAHHLKVDPAKSTMVSAVIDGMPAKAAGLEKFDVIVSIDGKPAAGMNELRRAIAATEPGTKVKLAVRRGADTKEFVVEAAAFDPERLAASDGFPSADFADAEVAGGGESSVFFIGPDGKKREMRIPSMRGLQMMPNMPGIDPRQFEQMERSLREMRERMERQFGEAFGRGPDEEQAAPAPAPRMAPKRAPRQNADPGDERLRRMEERMEDLRRELERERESRKGPSRPADA